VASATLDGFGAVHQNLGATYVAAQPGWLEGGTLCLPHPPPEGVMLFIVLEPSPHSHMLCKYGEIATNSTTLFGALLKILSRILVRQTPSSLTYCGHT